MSIRDVFQFVRRHGTLIILGAGISTGISILVWLAFPPPYTSSSEIYVSAQSSTNNESAFQGAQLSEERVKSYAQLATGARVLDESNRRLGPLTANLDLSQIVRASAQPGSVILTVSATSDEAATSALISNTVSSTLANVVTEVEGTGRRAAQSPVILRQVSPASLPLSRDAPPLLLAALLGFVVGGGLAAGVAALRTYLEPSVLDEKSLGALTSAPVLGGLDIAQRKEDSTGFLARPQSAYAEQLRRIRTSLRFAALGENEQVIMACGLRGREGVTSFAINLASSFSSLGAKALFIDANFRSPLTPHPLAGGRLSPGLVQVLSGQSLRSQAIQHLEGHADFLLAGGLPDRPGDLLSSLEMRSLISELRQTYEYIVIDAPPALPYADAALLTPLVDGFSIIALAGRSLKRDVKHAEQALTINGTRHFGAVLNGVPRAESEFNYGKYSNYYADEADHAKPLRRS